MTPTKNREAIFVFLHNRIHPNQMQGWFDYAIKVIGEEHRDCVKSFPEFSSQTHEKDFDIHVGHMQDSQKKFLVKHRALAESSESGEEAEEAQDQVEGLDNEPENPLPRNDQVAGSMPASSADFVGEPWQMAGIRDDNRRKQREEKKLKDDWKVGNKAGTRPCKFREFCPKGERCTWEHNDAERATFRMHGGTSPFKLSKYRDCQKDACKKQQAVRDLCPFFHVGLESRLCLSCLGIPCIAPNQCGERIRYERSVLVENDEKHCELRRKGWIKKS